VLVVQLSDLQHAQRPVHQVIKAFSAGLAAKRKSTFHILAKSMTINKLPWFLEFLFRAKKSRVGQVPAALGPKHSSAQSAFSNN
jgi:hypothetical protein